MEGDTKVETGWAFVAEGDSIPTIVDTLLRLDPGDAYTRSELAELTDIPLKTLHLMDDVERAVELGMLEKHDDEGQEVRYTIREDSEVLDRARAFGDAVLAHRDG